MKEPTFTADELQAEIDATESSGLKAMRHYAKIEIKRRKRSQFNRGQPLKDDTPQRAKWREASARYRNK